MKKVILMLIVLSLVCLLLLHTAGALAQSDIVIYYGRLKPGWGLWVRCKTGLQLDCLNNRCTQAIVVCP